MPEIKTDERFWDCECEHYYIHAKSIDKHCDLCGANADEQPDGRVAEIGRGGLFATDRDWLVAYNISEYYDSLERYATDPAHRQQVRKGNGND